MVNNLTQLNQVLIVISDKAPYRNRWYLITAPAPRLSELLSRYPYESEIISINSTTSLCPIDQDNEYKCQDLKTSADQDNLSEALAAYMVDARHQNVGQTSAESREAY